MGWTYGDQDDSTYVFIRNGSNAIWHMNDLYADVKKEKPYIYIYIYINAVDLIYSALHCIGLYGKCIFYDWMT